MRCCGALQDAARSVQLALFHREPWDEAEVVLFAEMQDCFVGAVRDVVFILHAVDGGRFLGALDILYGDFGESDVPNLAFFLHFLQFAQRVFNRYLRIDAMKLIQIDAFEFQAVQAHLDALTQVLRAPNDSPLVGSLAGESAFGGDHQVRRVRMQSLSDKTFADFRAVRVGRVDEIYAEIGQAFQDALCFFAIFGFAPDPGAGNTHRAETQAMDREVPADGESAACRVR